MSARHLLFSSLLLFFVVSVPPRTKAQLVREGAPATPAQVEANAAAGTRRVSQEISISGDDHWMDTGIDVKPGERVVIIGSGKIHYADAPAENGPEGRARDWKDLLRILPLKDAGRGALIARIGEQDIGQPFLVGARRDLTAITGGHLYLGVNQDNNDSADGSYSARVEIYAAEKGAKPGAAAARDVGKIPGVDAALFARIPRRVSDKDGNPGDMINFLILGSEATMQRAFEQAGWVKVDRTSKDAVLTVLIESLSKESYVKMPMSELYLFGRSQDYGYAHAEPVSVVSTRHHLRLWKAAGTVNGQTLWVGAATHDIGFERDRRNDGITHKIDPDIDAERDYVEKTLSATGLVSEKTHFLPDNSVKEASTATGGSFHSSGQVLILELAEPHKAAASR